MDRDQSEVSIMSSNDQSEVSIVSLPVGQDFALKLSGRKRELEGSVEVVLLLVRSKHVLHVNPVNIFCSVHSTYLWTTSPLLTTRKPLSPMLVVYSLRSGRKIYCCVKKYLLLPLFQFICSPECESIIRQAVLEPIICCLFSCISRKPCKQKL